MIQWCAAILQNAFRQLPLVLLQQRMPVVFLNYAIVLEHHLMEELL